MKRGFMFFMMLMLILGFGMTASGQGQPTGSLVLTESFSDTIFPRPGWIADGVTRITTASAFYSAPAAANFGTHSGSLTLPDVPHPSLLRFWLGRTTATTPKLMIVEVSDDGDPTTFIPVDTFDNDNTDAGTFTLLEVDLSAYSHIPAVTIRFRKASATTSPWRLDDIEVYASSSLPVELISFRGEYLPGQGVMLRWVTASERDNDRFTILRADERLLFNPAGTVAGGGTTHSTNRYQWLDAAPTFPITYYRLVQTDYDGTTDTLPMIGVKVLPEGLWDIASVRWDESGLVVTSSDELMGGVTFMITDMAGRLVHQQREEVSGQKIFSLRVKLLPGIYVLLVTDSTHRVTRKFSVDP